MLRLSLPAFGKKTERRARLTLDRQPAVIYAVGDVHGCLDLLLELEERIAADAKSVRGDKLILMLGDYVDRGPKSAQVLDHLIEAPPSGFTRICLAGNHEDAMSGFLATPNPRANWLDFGGRETLLSYGIPGDRIESASKRALEAMVESYVPREHRTFLASLPVSVETPDFLFVHAGIRPDRPWQDQSDEDLLWYQDDFRATYVDSDLTIVHGHIITETPLLTARRICTDTGAYVSGVLSAVRLTSTGPSVLQVGHAHVAMPQKNHGLE